MKMKTTISACALGFAVLAAPASAQEVNCESGSAVASCTVSAAEGRFHIAEVYARWVNGRSSPSGDATIKVYPGRDPHNEDKARLCGKWETKWPDGTHEVSWRCPIFLKKGENVVFRARAGNKNADAGRVELEVR